MTREWLSALAWSAAGVVSGVALSTLYKRASLGSGKRAGAGGDWQDAPTMPAEEEVNAQEEAVAVAPREPPPPALAFEDTNGEDIPEAFVDPITFGLMTDPVVLCGTGVVYDGASLRSWFVSASARRCPKTTILLRDVEVVRLPLLRSLVHDWARRAGHALPSAEPSPEDVALALPDLPELWAALRSTDPHRQETAVGKLNDTFIAWTHEERVRRSELREGRRQEERALDRAPRGEDAAQNEPVANGGGAALAEVAAAAALEPEEALEPVESPRRRVQDAGEEGAGGQGAGDSSSGHLDPQAASSAAAAPSAAPPPSPPPAPPFSTVVAARARVKEALRDDLVWFMRHGRPYGCGVAAAALSQSVDPSYLACTALVPAVRLLASPDAYARHSAARLLSTLLRQRADGPEIAFAAGAVPGLVAELGPGARYARSLAASALACVVEHVPARAELAAAGGDLALARLVLQAEEDPAREAALAPAAARAARGEFLVRYDRRDAAAALLNARVGGEKLRELGERVDAEVGGPPVEDAGQAPRHLRRPLGVATLKIFAHCSHAWLRNEADAPDRGFAEGESSAYELQREVWDHAPELAEGAPQPADPPAPLQAPAAE